jgi:two-component system, chemotaxis family, sensor kinase CheA
MMRQPPNTVANLDRKKAAAFVDAAFVSAFVRPRILVADNDPTTTAMLASIANGAAYRIVSVKDGREAYRVLMEDADFAVAVFNMTMPHLHGSDLVRHMRTEKRLLRIPVIIVSGDDGIRTVADSFAAGAIAFLSKPFAAEQLQRTLLLALSSKESKQQVAQAA